jgi:hypothetical protein
MTSDEYPAAAFAALERGLYVGVLRDQYTPPNRRLQPGAG